MALLQLRFIVPSIDVRETPGAENLNHGLGLRRMMSAFGRKRIRRCEGIAMQHGRESCSTETLEEVTA